MDGILRCSRYAFGPNRLHYCGPDAHQEIHGYIKHGARDPGLEHLLSRFETLYPYLQLIASSNNIRDPFDDRVVEAYWLGNTLLDRVEQQQMYRHLTETPNIYKKVKRPLLDQTIAKIPLGALPHHSFHVLNIWQRTGHFEREHTVESLDACRVSTGVVTNVVGPKVTVRTNRLLHENGKLRLSAPRDLAATRPFDADASLEELAIGDTVSMHWGVVCEKISPLQARTVEAYTKKHLDLANLTI